MTSEPELRRRIRRNALLLALLAVAVYVGYVVIQATGVAR